MASGKEIKGKIGSIKNTQKITSATGARTYGLWPSICAKHAKSDWSHC